MGMKKYKPTTPGRRQMSTVTFEDITRKKGEKSLMVPLKRRAGRNNRGKITTYHQGGGHKRLYRIIDFKRDKDNIPAVVESIEYDPNRSARIALLKYKDGEKRYIIAPHKLEVGTVIISGDNVDIKPGNVLPLKNIPFGTLVHCVEMKKGKGAQMIRTAGGYAQVVARDRNYVHLKLPSGQVRLIHQECRATVGQISNLEHENVSIGKAGRSRWLGIRPTTRGVAMNPVDHTMGGGEGKTSGGRHPCTPWGKPTKGYKTRKKNKPSNRYIIKVK